MSKRDDTERALERLLDDDSGDKFGSIYRRLPRQEPPRRIDRNVLAEAARAVHGRPPRRQRWQVAFGSAAGLVLVAGIAWHIGQDASHAPAPASFSRPEVVPVHPLDREPGASTVNQQAQTAPQSPAPAMQASKPAVPFPQAAKRKAATTDSKASADVAPPRSERSDEGALRDDEHKSEANTADVNSAAPAAPPTPNEAATLNARARSAIAAESSEARTPVAWIEHIRALMRQGRLEEAKASLHALRSAHQHAQIPADERVLEQ